MQISIKKKLKKIWGKKQKEVKLNNLAQMDGSGNNGDNPKEQDLPSLSNLNNTENLSKNIKILDKRLVTLWEPYSAVSEQYRKLRTHILDASRSDGKKVFLVSSAVRGEGKTLTAINLAISIASGLHETALLIDADLRSPSISQVLGFKKDTRGLAEYLTCGGNLADFITRTSIPKLSIITAGLPLENPFEMISSRYMFDLIKEVKYRYDNRYIIIDAPPLIPVTDPVSLSSLADGIIIVVRASTTQRETVSDAINKIENKEKILGIILNNCKSIMPKYTYYNNKAHQK